MKENVVVYWVSMVFPLVRVILVGIVFFRSAVSVYAVGGVLMTIEPNMIEMGKSGKLFIDVDPAGNSLNIIQAHVRFDPKAWNIASCTPHDAFKGIAGQPACLVDAASGTVKLQMETQSARGPKQKTRVATVGMSRKGTENDTITMQPGQIVVQNDSGQSSLLSMPDMVNVTIRNDGGTNELSGPGPETGSVERGFFQSIAAWFSRLFGFGGK